MMHKIGVMTSGGDSPGMNAAIRAVVRTALSKGFEVYGVYNGYKGLVEGNIEQLNRHSVSEMLGRGGTILGTARLPEFREEAVRKQAVEKLNQFGIDSLVVIGGDGTYRGAMELCKLGIPCVGIPGTIDNDIPSSDFAIGFDTALNTVVEAVDKLRDTSSSHRRCSVVEVMGNHCGDLAIWAGIASGAEIVITVETGYHEEEVLEQLNYFHDVVKKNHAIVVLSEKMTDIEAFAKKISTDTGFDGRATVLGHVQRGGSPSPFDRVLASRLGNYAVELIDQNIGGVCVGILNNQITATPFEEAMVMNKTNTSESLYRLFQRIV